MMEQTLDNKYLGVIASDFIKVADQLKEASYLIRKRGSYPYPIFPMALIAIELGSLVVAPNELDNQWYYYATYLDALIECQIIAPDKITDFKNTYKDPDEFCCLLVVDQGSVNFVYIPYPVD
jgi:hypothetical protein